MNERREKLRRMKLYALLTEEHCRRSWRWTAAQMLEGGVDVLQLREKRLDGRELLKRAEELRKMTERFGALLIINDRPDVALLSGADGVHLGQDDLPPERVREMVGGELLIGLSTHTAGQAREARSRSADYIGVGPVYPTDTKGYGQGGGPALVAQLCAATDLPTVAIGGITLDRTAEVVAAGADAIAVCQALCASSEPGTAARQFVKLLEQRARKRRTRNA